MTRLFWCVYLNGKKALLIPLNKIAKGVDLCLENASQFCSDAKVLMEKTSYDHALGFCIFAIEEFGKAILLKSKALYAQKDSKVNVVLDKEKPENLFHSTTEYLKAKGFRCGKEVYPFYDHLSKLLMASNMMYMAIDTNIGKSIRGKKFYNVDEINKTFKTLWEKAYELDFYKTDLRELTLNVDYDQKQGMWKKGRLELTEEQLRQLITDIETAIEIYRK